MSALNYLDRLPDNHALLLLQRLPGVGCQTLHQLLEQHSAHAILLEGAGSSLLKAEAQHALHTWRQSADTSPLGQQVLRDSDYLQSHDIKLLSPNDDGYPALLAEIERPPALLMAQGKLDSLQQPSLAIVGTRHPSGYGLDNAHAFAKTLARAGMSIVSGLALGIDGAAHSGALAGHGTTVAVIGTGLDRCYPARHRHLAQDILQTGGCLLSEFALGSPPRAGHFPQRNRIISGLSLGVLVIEAALKSGSLITARLAGEHNREVFALPGSIHNPQAHGCHQLLREGATLCEQVEDIFTQLSAWQGVEAQTDISMLTSAPAFDTDERLLLNWLGYEARSLDELAALSQWPAAKLQALLLQLELKNAVQQGARGIERRFIGD